MKIAIYGAGNCGEYVIKEINEAKKSNVEGTLFIDNNPIYKNKLKCNVPIVDLECFMKDYSRMVQAVLIAVSDGLMAQEMAVSLLNKSYKNIYLIPEELWAGKLKVLNSNGDLASYIKHISNIKPILPYIEYHVSDFCNLKCKRCGHFSNLVTEKKFPDITEFGNTLEKLRQKFRNIKIFRLMGGEPFVNPNLRLFIYKVKDFFPYADIRIVSNGLIIPQIEQQTIKSIKECGATIDISQYLPTRNMIEEILQFTWDNNLKIQVGEKITRFFKSIGAGISEDYERIYSNCISRKCYFLRGESLYACPAVILPFENKEFLKIDINKDDIIHNSFNLISGNEDGWDILKVFLSPFTFCKYCTDIEWHNWRTSNGKIKKEDWIVNN